MNSGPGADGVFPPAAKCRYLLLSVDTEPDNPAWGAFRAVGATYHNLKALPRLAEIVNELGLKATLFTTHSTVRHPEFARAVEPLLKTGSEIAAHLHGGDAPPFGPWDREAADNLLRLEDGVLEEKLVNLHQCISRKFGIPRAYRSGAWTVDGRILRLLEREGYVVDSSVTPGISWKLIGRPEYLEAPRGAYRPDPDMPSRPGNAGLWEVPVSVWSPPAWRRLRHLPLLGHLWSMPLHSRRSPALRLLRLFRPFKPLWLRPAFSTLEEMRLAVQGLETEADYAHIMLHSNELMQGASPYSPSRDAVEGMLALLRTFCRELLERGYRPFTLTGYALEVKRGGGAKVICARASGTSPAAAPPD